jgi:cytochrome c
MLNVKKPRDTRFMLATIFIAASAILAWNAIAQTPPGAAGSGAAGSGTAGSTATAISGDVNAGAEIFDSVCEECHGAAATAPTLRGIIGRPFASIDSFDGYSDALKAKRSLTWTPANLDSFLKSPKDFVPGTLMYKTVPDAKDRADIIAFLASLPPPRTPRN